MARVPYISALDGVATPELAGLYQEIAGLRGAVLNLYQALGNQPAALRAFMTMSRYIRDDAELPAHLRELAVLATAYTLQAPYEIYHHLTAARRAGVREEQIASFPNWAEVDHFDEVERAVLAYAEEVARRRDVDEATWAAVRQHLPTGQIIDLALTVGWYHLCAAVLGPLRIETEEQTGRDSAALG